MAITQDETNNMDLLKKELEFAQSIIRNQNEEIKNLKAKREE